MGFWNHVIMNHLMLANHASWARWLRLRSPERATDLLEIIHTDVCGPMSVKAHGKYQVIHNQVIPKSHQHGVSSCALHQYDLNGSATNKLHLSLLSLHLLVSMLWICVSLRSRSNKSFSLVCMTTEGFIHVNRTTSVLYLKWIAVLQ